MTKQIKRGENSVEVIAIGTLKDALRLRHCKSALGAAWPSTIHIGPTPGPPARTNYSTVAYGLFDPFVLRQIQ